MELDGKEISKIIVCIDVQTLVASAVDYNLPLGLYSLLW